MTPVGGGAGRSGRRPRGAVRCSRPRLALGGFVAALSLAAPAPVAHAHGEYSPTIRTVIDRVAPSVPGLELRTLTAGTARLSAVNRTTEELVVLAPTGEPFLGIGPRGVRANVHSLYWYRTGNPDGIGNPPRGVRVGGRPRWESISSRPAWSWFDHRMHPGTVPVPRAAVQAQRPARLDDWTVPMRLGRRAIEVSGHVEYRPLVGSVVPELQSPAAVAPGIQVALLSGQLPGLFLVNQGTRTVTVTGRGGEPFARIGPRGVQVNLRSPTHVDDQLAKGTGPPGQADPAAAPRWRRVGAAPRYAWLETRAFYDAQRISPEVIRRRRAVVLSRWAVPLRIGGRRLAIAGVTRWKPFRIATPVRDDGNAGVSALWLAPAALLVVAALGGAFVLRRARARR